MCIFLSKWRFYCPECPHHFVFCYFSNKVIDWKLLPWQRHSLNEDGWATKNMSIDADFSAVHVAFQSWWFCSQILLSKKGVLCRAAHNICQYLQTQQNIPLSKMGSQLWRQLQDLQILGSTISYFPNIIGASQTQINWLAIISYEVIF